MNQREVAQAQRISDALHQSVTELRTWVTKRTKEGNPGAYFPQWEPLYRLGERLIEQVAPAQWGATVEVDLHYLIAQDRGARRLLSVLARQPGALVCLAEEAIDSPDWEVRSELATAIGQCDSPDPRLNELLITFACDPHEFVARCALLALAERRSSAAEVFALKAWASPNADQRVAALHALATVRSQRLPWLLSGAMHDPHPYVRQAAVHLQSECL